jgi:hypothetical protein
MGNANTTRQATVNTRFLRVRLQPGKSGQILGLLKQGSVVDVLRVTDGWAQVEIKIGGSGMRFQSTPDAVLAYLQADYLTFANQPSPAPAPQPQPAPAPAPDNPPPREEPKPAPAPAPQPVAPYYLGLNALQNTNFAMEEANRGCKFFLIMNDFGGAANIKRAHPNAIVVARRWFPQAFFLSPDQVIEGLEGANLGGLVYMGFNEADQGGQDGEALRTRARIDIEVARRIKAKHGANYGVGKTFYAAGTFSMGTPDFTNPETCRIIREEYAPHYNAGLIGLDMHLYSPNPQHIDKPDEFQWFERRWEFLFTKCGFDPSVRAIYCTETGLDQGGIGGFPAHGVSHEYFREWCRKFITLTQKPLVIDGRSYPSPALGGAIFQLGGNGDRRWEGYDVKGFLPVLRDFYNGISNSSAAKHANLPKIPKLSITSNDISEAVQKLTRAGQRLGGKGSQSSSQAALSRLKGSIGDTNKETCKRASGANERR